MESLPLDLTSAQRPFTTTVTPAKRSSLDLNEAHYQKIRRETHRIHLSPVSRLLKDIRHLPDETALILKQLPGELIPRLGNFPEKSVLDLKQFSDEVIIETLHELRLLSIYYHEIFSSDMTLIIERSIRL